MDPARVRIRGAAESCSVVTCEHIKHSECVAAQVSPALLNNHDE